MDRLSRNAVIGPMLLAPWLMLVPTEAEARGGCQTTELVTRNGTQVGCVDVSQDNSEQLTITYTTKKKYCIRRIQLEVANSVDEIPTTPSGWPRYWRFEDKKRFSSCQKGPVVRQIAIPADAGDSVVIAARAVARARRTSFRDGCTTFLPCITWGDGTPFTSRGPATYFEYTLETQPTEPTLVFLTSTGTTGGFGGLAAGDASCNQLATSAGLQGAGEENFVAWLSTDDEDARDRIPQTGPYIKNDGNETVIAETLADLLDGAIDSPINYDENRAQPPTGRPLVWTGTLTDGTNNEGLNCANWTTGDSATRGRIGTFNSTDQNWTLNAQASCNFPTNKLYCFGPLDSTLQE